MKRSAVLLLALLVSWLGTGPLPAVAAGTGQDGYAASDYVTGLSYGALGPVGVAFDGASNLYVANWGGDGKLYRFSPGGGTPATATMAVCCTSAFGLAVGPGGRLYATTMGSPSSVKEIDVETGVVIRTVVTAPSGAAFYGVAIDPLSQDLFVTTLGTSSVSIYRISNYTDGPGLLTPYASGDGSLDGIAFAPDGTIYATIPDAGVVKIAGTNSPTPGMLLQAVAVPGGPEGVAVAANSDYIAVNRNDGIITKVDFSVSPPTLTDIVTGGTRGDYATVGLDGCLYATQISGVEKVTNADGSCWFAPVIPPSPGATSGRGSIPSVSGTSSASFNFDLLQKVNGGAIAGGLTYQDAGANVKVQSSALSVLSVNANIATFSGIATINGSGSYTFSATVVDNGDAGLQDTFSIALSSGYGDGGSLTAGNIRVHEAQPPAPLVTYISPSSGPAAGGTTVTIGGANFVQGATVTIGGKAAGAVRVLSRTQMSAVTPPGYVGVQAVQVMNPDGQTGALAPSSLCVTCGFYYQ